MLNYKFRSSNFHAYSVSQFVYHRQYQVYSLLIQIQFVQNFSRIETRRKRRDAAMANNQTSNETDISPKFTIKNGYPQVSKEAHLQLKFKFRSI